VAGRTCAEDACVQCAGGQEGRVVAGPHHGAHAGAAPAGQDADALLLQVDPGHEGHVVDVIVLPEGAGEM